MIKKILKSEVFSNGVYLYILQIFNTIIPLLTLPYITRILGAGQYGIFSKSLNYITYCQTFVEYGFTLTGTKEISLCDSKEGRNKIFSRITYSKILLLFILIPIVAVLSFTITKNKAQTICLVILALMLFAEVFTQTWFFQGIQYMRPIMFISLISRTISTVCIFIFVKSFEDVLVYAAFYVASNLITALLGTIVAMKKFQIRFTSVDKDDILFTLKDGWPLFTTSFASKICSGFAITTLAFFCADEIIGGYSSVQKIPYILVMMFAPIGQAIYPFICRLYAEDVNKGIKFLKKVAGCFLCVCLIGVIVMIISRHWLINFVFGEDYLSYADLIIPLAFWMLLSIVNNFLGVQTLIARGYQKQYSRCFLMSIIVLIILCLALGYVVGAMGAAIATLIGELVLALGCMIVIVKNGLLKSSNTDFDCKRITDIPEEDEP